MAEKGWTRTAFEIYNNQKPAANNRSPWSLDEPVEGSDYRALRYLFNLARWAFEGAAARGITIVTRVDIGHWECDGLRTPEGTATGCYKAKDFGPANARALLQPVVDRWVVGHVHVHGAQDLVSRYNTERVMFDEYSGSGVSAAHGGEFSGLAWIAHRLGVEGRMVYHAGYLDPANVSGDGTLYNGRGLGFTGVLASRRVKLWRDAVNDYDLIALARKADAAATTALLEKVTRPGLSSDPSYRANSRTVETYVTNNVEDLLRARRLAAAIAAGRSRPRRWKASARATRRPARPTPSPASTDRYAAVVGDRRSDALLDAASRRCDHRPRRAGASTGRSGDAAVGLSRLMMVERLASGMCGRTTSRGSPGRRRGRTMRCADVPPESRCARPDRGRQRLRSSSTSQSRVRKLQRVAVDSGQCQSVERKRTVCTMGTLTGTRLGGSTGVGSSYQISTS